jgi:hypothetical protein
MERIDASDEKFLRARFKPLAQGARMIAAVAGASAYYLTEN